MLRDLLGISVDFSQPYHAALSGSREEEREKRTVLLGGNGHHDLPE